MLKEIQQFFFSLGCEESGTRIRKMFGDKSRTWLDNCYDGECYKLNSSFIRGLKHYGYELRLVKIKDIIPSVVTNGDYVRHMTDEELVEFLFETSGGQVSREEYERWLKEKY